MAKKTSPLRGLRVASPCSADWDEMWGNDRVRFCGHCNLNVYNLSGMSKVEAERLLASTEGRLCVRFYRRKDGTVLTQDCPVGLEAFKRRVNQIAVAVVSSALSLAASFGAMSLFGGRPAGRAPAVMGKIAAPAPEPPQHEVMRGSPVPPPFQGEVVMGVMEPPVGMGRVPRPPADRSHSGTTRRK
jgi:hypothetical protein